MLRLHAPNPHYLESDGEPLLLVGSGEHYGALLNADFDFERYFARLEEIGLNQCRVFSGTYRERADSFGIENNTLAPREASYVSPWRRDADGRFDLSRPNEAYTRRLHELMRSAARRHVVVELVLFCFWYNDELWRLSPMHPANNREGIGPEDRELVYSIRENALLAHQEAFVRTITAELSEYANLYYEICNEPYSRHDHTSYLEWQHHIADTIRESEAALRERHLIAINYENRTCHIPGVHEGVSILNFHYALPLAAASNHHFDLPIGNDETGFMGQSAEAYRHEAWSFLCAGGAIHSHLDYGFTCAHPDGTARIEGNTPGYGGDDLRYQLAFMRRFLEELEVWKLRPANEIFAQNSTLLAGQALCDPGWRYLVYLPYVVSGTTIGLWLPPGEYRARWVVPNDCRVSHESRVEVTSGYHRLNLPMWEGDLAFVLDRDETIPRRR